MIRDKVILVDKDDNVIGEAPKLEAHQQGLLHRAFSIQIINAAGELLLQKRASGKYHSPKLWTNTCCSHPQLGETTLEGAQARLKMEMGIETPLEYIDKFTYRVDFPNGLSEYEVDYVYLGEYNGAVMPNPEEASDYQWISMSGLEILLAENPEHFTYWFPFVLSKVKGKV